MVRSICAGVLAMWILMPGEGVAWPLEAGAYPISAPLCPSDPRAPGLESPYLDPATGAILSLSRKGHGAVMLTVAVSGLEVTKRVTPAGGFDLRLLTEDDDVRLTLVRNRLTVARGGSRAVLDSDAVDDLAVQRIQVVLAGSGAVRRFRQIFAALSDTTRRRPEGAALAIIEAVLGWLQGDVDAVRRVRPEAAADGIVTMSEADGGGSCYTKWEAEVIAAWNDYESCVLSFEWWNPLREVCAFLWVIRVESAWFTMIGCSAIPIKIEGP